MFGEQLVIGAAMILLTVVVHITGIVGLVAYLKRCLPEDTSGISYRSVLWLLGLTILGVFALHIVEIWAWALLYLWLGEFVSLELSLYFSTVTFTTLGFGDVTLQERWRLLSSFEAANGILLFGVSTAFVFAVMRKLFEVANIIGHE